MKALFCRASNSLVFWLLLDLTYLVVFLLLSGQALLPLRSFFVAHAAGIAVGTTVMFTGVGAGVVWFPFFTLVGFHPAEAASFSLFNQMAGKGSGSLKYLREKMVDMPVALSCIPWAVLGVSAGYLAGFVAPRRYDRWLLLLFAAVVLYLLVAMLAGRKGVSSPDAEASASRPNRLLVTGSSFFTGILSVGTSDWLIPHMVRRLRMPVSQAVATGIFVMFSTAVIFWLLIVVSVMSGWRDWPQNPPILLGTVPGVILGGQIGSRLIRFPRLRYCQSAVFVGILVLSAGHMIWEFFHRG
jgi:uncharacterized membrane protein YfcA